MWVTEEVSLVEFYQSGLNLAKEAGYEIVLCFVAREADAPRAYDGIIEAWQSIDDLTGPKILFLFAGPSVRADHKSENIHRNSDQSKQDQDRLLYSPHALMLHSTRLASKQSEGISQLWQHSAAPHFDLRELRKHLASRQASPPRRGDIAASQTSQIRELRAALGLGEKDVPCFHFTFLDGTAPLPIPVTPEMNVYSTLKTVVEAMATHEEERARIAQRKSALVKERQSLQSKKSSHEHVFEQLMSLLEGMSQAEAKTSANISELVTALRTHAKWPTENTRRKAFDCFQSAREILSARSDWQVTRSGLQRLIDIASYHGAIGIFSANAMDGDMRDERRSLALRRVEEELHEIERLKKRHSRVSIGERVKVAISGKTNYALDSFVIVAARQEIEAVRSYLDLLGAYRETYHLSDTWAGERVTVDRGQLEFALFLAPGQGLEDMGDVLGLLQQHAKPKTVILVGMMAGIPGKSGLLDVQAPRNIINGSGIGTRDGRIVSEPRGRDVDPVLHSRLNALDPRRRQIADIKLVTHKNSICVAGKFDDLTPELAQRALESDPENIIGIEMEGSALTAKQAGQRRSGQETGYIMIKGVADYAGAKPSPEEVARLRSALELSGFDRVDELLANPDPTTNKTLKSALQKEATIRAMRVALALMKEGLK